jgi:hypothetical protein
VACVGGAFVGREQLERDGDEAADLVEVARARGAQEGFQFSERELDRIKVRTIGREESHERAHLLDRPPHLRLFVDREVMRTLVGVNTLDGVMEHYALVYVEVNITGTVPGPAGASTPPTK